MVYSDIYNSHSPVNKSDYTMSNLYLCLLILGFIVLAYMRFYTQYIHIQLRRQPENVFIPANAVVVNHELIENSIPMDTDVFLVNEIV